ncbi:MAG: hypothetical protein GF349_02505 [Candidatus Magasanikbacteria bacterium]|nr:hypothetical protein [Candidatus Magasanikbacteria bacterium]
MEYSLIIVFSLLFTFIAAYRFHLGLFFLFLLLPTYLIRFNIGPLPTTLLEVMIWIILIIWLIKYNKSITYHLSHIIRRYTNFFIASFLFLLAATISVFTSINTRAALGEWKAFYIEPFLIFLVLLSINPPFNSPPYKGGKGTECQGGLVSNRIILALVLSGLATSLLSIYQHFTGWMVPWEFWENRDSFRVTGWYGFPNAVGLFLAPIIPLAIYLAIKNLKKIKNKPNKGFFTYRLSVITSILFILTSIPAIIFAKSTGGLVGVVAGIGLLLLFYKKTRLWTIGLGLAGLLILIITPMTNPVKQELLMQDRSGQLRINMWAETVEFLQDHPLKGAGLASYKTLIYPYRIDKWVEVFHHPHNIFLTMWVNLGILGLFGFIWILISLITHSFHSGPLACHLSIIKNRNKLSNINYYLLASLAVILTTGLVDSPYIKNDLSIFFWFLLASLLINLEKKRSSV